MLCVIEDCNDCAAEEAEKARRGHECGEVCELIGEGRRANPERHQLTHQPLLCDDCGSVIADGAYAAHDGLRESVCPIGCCLILTCKACGSDWGGMGPVMCPHCNPTGARWRPERVKRIHRQYATRRR